MARPRLTHRLLAAPVRHAVRRIALVLLLEVVREHSRLLEDAGSLHDFRVALRRLRSWLRAYRPWFRDTIGGRSFRALGSLAGATNRGREIEVALEWLAAQDALPADAAAARDRLVTKWQRESRDASRQFDRRLAAKFISLSTRLRRRLGAYRVSVTTDRPGEHPPARAIVAGTIRAHAESLGAALAEVRSASDVAEAHRARIAGKRLRYLLEPLSRNRGTSPLIKRLAELQDVLGDFHDSHQLSERIERARSAGEAAQASGLTELERRARERAGACFAGLQREWLGEGLRLLLADVAVISDRISKPASSRRRRQLA